MSYKHLLAACTYMIVLIIFLCEPLAPSPRFVPPGRGGGYSHTLPIRVCVTLRGRDFEAPDLERGIIFRSTEAPVL